MKITKVLVAALLLSGITMSANEPLLLKSDGTGESSSSKTLNFKKKHQSRDLFKLSTSRLLHSSSARDWDEAEVNGGGLFINFGIHFPSSKFLNPYYGTFLTPYQSDAARYKLGFDFEIGNYFRFAKIADGKVGIGLRATWLSLSYTAMTDNKDIYRALQISALRVGPQAGFAINESMGVDVYYQIGYNFTDMFASINDPINGGNYGVNATYQGLSHEIGAAFHFRVFSVGMGYRFGKLTNTTLVSNGKDEDADTKEKYSVGNFRITLGFKF